MLDALVSGTTDPEVLAELAKGMLRKKLPALRHALRGRFTSHHALVVGHILAYVDYLDDSIAALSEEIERVIAPFSDKVELLDSIPGVDKKTAEVVLAEIGTDMAQFATHRHLASWAGICPGSDQSAGKHVRLAASHPAAAGWPLMRFRFIASCSGISSHVPTSTRR
jgi:transposase